MPNNQQRGEEALKNLNREIKSRDRKEKSRPLGVVAVSALAIVSLVGGMWFMATRDESDNVAQNDPSTTIVDTPTETPQAEALSGSRATALPASVQCEYPADSGKSSDAKAPQGKDISTQGVVTVTFNTTQGAIPVEMDRAAAPCTVNAIESLAKQGYYDDTICHRMTSGGLAVLQCGDPTGSGAGGPGFQFANEYPTDEATDLNSPVVYPRGSVAMANAGQDTNGSQFFLNYADSMLPPLYTYFGNVTADGLDTLDKIAAIGIEGGASDGAPAEEIKIESAKVKV
ncbi:MAG: peptidylprolyl isomerase [Corynebacterium sp.]|nr:peptidylprolyl isomerase [Corynebacterium sp.]